MERTYIEALETDLPRLCMGGWQAAGWHKSDDAVFVKTIHKALDLGINFIDTAEGYGKGHSENLIGKALKGIRKEVVISTKFSCFKYETQQIKTSLEGSLKRLKTDYVDLYMYHWPAPGAPLNRIVDDLQALKAEGKVKAIGVSNWMEPEWNEVGDPSRVDFLQPCYSLLWRSIEKNVLPLCIENKIAVFPYSPLCQGILAGRFQNVTELPKDPRSHNVLLKSEKFKEIEKIINVVKETAGKYGKTLSQTALRWLLQREGVTAPITGASSPGQIAENAGALGWMLEEEDVEALAEVSAPLSEKLESYDTLWNWHPRRKGA